MRRAGVELPKTATSGDAGADDPLPPASGAGLGLEPAEDRYRLLLQVSEAVNSRLEIAGVLEALASAIRPLVPLTGVGVLVSDHPGNVCLHSVYIEGVPPQPGESVAQALERAWDTTPYDRLEHEDLADLTMPPAGTTFEHVERTRSTLLCSDFTIERRFADIPRMAAIGAQSGVFVPLCVHERFLGAAVYVRLDPPPFNAADAARLEELTTPVATAVANSLAYAEIQRLQDLLRRENAALREEVDERGMFKEILGDSPAMRGVLERVEKVAPTDATVLITGETGTGKELIARAIHRCSGRSAGPLVSVNCAALSPALVASELFGHEKGAFTGAVQRRVGRFELAAGGSIFLDEVGDLPGDVQVALLRVLQEHTFERVGGNHALRTDARVIAATHRDLDAAVVAGDFRSDLLYRLNVFPIDLPPLRERLEDIPMLVDYFAARHAARRGRRFAGVDPHSLRWLVEYPWPGNVRELENVIERAMILSAGDVLHVEGPPAPRTAASSRTARPAGRVLPDGPVNLRTSIIELEKQKIEEALAACRGRVAGRQGAARVLGLPPNTLENKIRLHGIDKYRFRSSS